MGLQYWQVKQRQALPLEIKIKLSRQRIVNWYNHWKGQVYVSFSGGKDSTVLLHLVRQEYPHIPAVFVDTGLEYPEVRQFVKTFDNVTWLKPAMNFKQVLETYGYPVISKELSLKLRQVQTLPKDSITYKLRMEGITSSGEYKAHGKIPDKWKYLINAPFKISEQCCRVMKKAPLHEYGVRSKRSAFIGNMASDSNIREKVYMRHGCNNLKTNVSMPIAFWTEANIWQYIKLNKIPYCPVYDTGITRTGCIFCMFGVHLEKGENRFQILRKTHPKLHDYCINKLKLNEVLDYLNVEY